MRTEFIKADLPADKRFYDMNASIDGIIADSGSI